MLGALKTPDLQDREDWESEHAPVHEAGHAIALFTFNIPIARMDLHPPGSATAKTDFEMTRPLEDHQYDAIALAGAAAEVLLYGEAIPWGLVGDLRLWLTWRGFRQLSPQAEKRAALTLARGIADGQTPLDVAYREARDLIAVNLAVVTALADALKAKGHLDGAQVRRILTGQFLVEEGRNIAPPQALPPSASDERGADEQGEDDLDGNKPGDEEEHGRLRLGF